MKKRSVLKNKKRATRYGGELLVAFAIVLMTVFNLRADYDSTVLNDHPVAFYPLDLTNSVATDLSGNGNDGVYVNIDPSVNNVPGPSAYITNAVSFDGATTYVDLGQGRNPGLLNFAGKITMEAWVQARDINMLGNIIAKGYSIPNGWQEVQMRCYQQHYGVGAGKGANGGSVTTSWVHVVGVNDGTNWNLFVNGGLVATTADTAGAINMAVPWAIGDGTADGSTRHFNGNITHVALYTNALTSQQIMTHYLVGTYGTAGVPPKLLSQPAPQMAVLGGTATFNVQVSSALPLTNQWFKNGSPVVGATNLSLTLSNVQPTDAGSYSITVGNLAGTTNSLSCIFKVVVPVTQGTYEDIVLNDQPVAFYPLYLTNGAVATDLSGNGNDGVYENIDPSVNSVPGPSAYITNAVSFDGATTYVDLGQGSHPELLNFGGTITMEAWVQAADTGELGDILAEGYDSAQGFAENQIRCYNHHYEGGTGASGGSVTTNWVHLVCINDGANWKLFLNGNLANTRADTVGAINFTDPWSIGTGSADGITRLFYGNITHVALYTYALTSQQIQTHYLVGTYGTVGLPPMILSQPASQSAVLGGTATLNVQISSILPVTNQWFKSGSPIVGATNLSLTLSNVQPTDAGSYSITVGNQAGTTNSLSCMFEVVVPGAYGVSPVTLTADSYNQKAIIPAFPLVTTASLSGGTNNNSWALYEQGLIGDTNTGLPAAGSTFTNYSLPDHSYIMAPSYTANDAVLIDSSVTQATITLTTPAPYAALSFVMVSASSDVAIQCTVHHADSTTETNTITSRYLYAGQNVAIYAHGLVDVHSRVVITASGTSGPQIGSQDITLTNAGSAVTSIDLAFSAGIGHACILAVSGATGGNFSPIAMTGYNEDMIVEAGLPVFVPGSYTTVSMEKGTGNTGVGWYEVGFADSGSGVPVHGSTITSQTQPDHQYTLPQSYTANDVAFLDSSTGITLTPVTPATLYTLSFLTASAYGPVNLNYTIHHADGTTEAGTFSSPDWGGGGAVAWSVRGYVDVQTGASTTWSSGGTQLQSVDINVYNTTSKVTSIDLSYGDGNQTGSSAQIMAVSAAFTNQQHIFTQQAKNADGSINLSFAGIPGYKYQVQFATNLTPPVAWQNLSTNSANADGVCLFTDSNATNRPAGFYRAKYLP